MSVACQFLSRVRLLILCFLLPLGIMAQTKEIKGVVTNSAGAAAPGVTVTVKGTKNSKATGSDGSFTLTAKEGDVLVFSGVSFETREVPVTSNATY
jgi:iron complex outermembrane receptor protein